LDFGEGGIRSKEGAVVHEKHASRIRMSSMKSWSSRTLKVCWGCLDRDERGEGFVESHNDGSGGDTAVDLSKQIEGIFSDRLGDRGERQPVFKKIENRPWRWLRE